MAHFIKVTAKDDGAIWRVNVDLIDTYAASGEGSWMESRNYIGSNALYVTETPEQIDYLIDQAMKIPNKAPWQR